MKRKSKHRMLILVFLVLAALACGTGYSTRTTIFPDRGEIVIKADNDNGSRETDVEFGEDYT